MASLVPLFLSEGNQMRGRGYGSKKHAALAEISPPTGGKLFITSLAAAPPKFSKKLSSFYLHFPANSLSFEESSLSNPSRNPQSSPAIFFTPPASSDSIFSGISGSWSDSLSRNQPLP